MDWLTNLLPEGFNYWVVACLALGVLNVYQFAKARGLTSKLDHMFEHGHAPEGKVVVPSAVVAPPVINVASVPPWERKQHE